MKVLVTGCAGFIGSKVSELLTDSGHCVVGTDNLNDAYDPQLKEWRLSRLLGRPTFTFLRLDITERQNVDHQLEHHDIEAIINLAARAGVRQSLLDPWAYYDTNVTGTLNLLEFSRRRHIQKLILASTSSLYGRNARPFREDQSTDRPLSPYAASKKSAETLCYTYHHLFGLHITVLRYFTVYGPAGRPEMSIFRFIRWMAEGEQTILYGDGEQERDFTFVDDVARGTVLALPLPGYEIINLGSDRPVSIRRVIALLEQLMQQHARIRHEPPHPTDVPATWADIEKARRLLGWEPATRLEEGLNAAVKWYEANRTWASRIAVGG